MTLQKELAIYRMTVNKTAGKYEYQLFKNGKFVKTRKTDREYNFAAVNVSPEDGTIRMDSFRKNASQFDRYDMEDPNTFIVSVTIKS